MIGTVVAVDAADLERLVRLAHQLNADVAMFVQYTPYECAYHVRQALAGRIEFP